MARTIATETRVDGRAPSCAPMVDQGKVLIRLVPDQWGPISTGGFPARLTES